MGIQCSGGGRRCPHRLDVDPRVEGHQLLPEIQPGILPGMGEIPQGAVVRPRPKASSIAACSVCTHPGGQQFPGISKKLLPLFT